MLLFLDRDGVINEDSDDYVRSLEDWIPVPGSIDAIAELSLAGFTTTRPSCCRMKRAALSMLAIV